MPLVVTALKSNRPAKCMPDSTKSEPASVGLVKCTAVSGKAVNFGFTLTTTCVRAHDVSWSRLRRVNLFDMFVTSIDTVWYLAQPGGSRGLVERSGKVCLQKSLCLLVRESQSWVVFLR